MHMGGLPHLSDVPDLAAIFDAPTEPETAPEPTPELTPTTEPEIYTENPTQKDEKSTTDKFADEISIYPDRTEARKHYQEIAEKLNCSAALGYKAERRVKVWQQNKKTAKTATFKIGDGKNEEPETEDSPPLIFRAYEEQPPQKPVYEAPFNNPTAPYVSDMTPQLTEVIQHQAPKCLNHVFEMLNANGIGNGESFLDQQDSADLAVLLPIIVKKITGTEMSAETTENVALGTFAAQLTLKGIKNRVKNRPIKKQQEKERQPEPTPEPTPTAPEPKKDPIGYNQAIADERMMYENAKDEAAKNRLAFQDGKPRCLKDIP